MTKMQQSINSQNIYTILANGENEKIEFKKSIRNFEILGKLISAFANTNGGIIIIGYDEQSQNIVGVSEKDRQNIISFIYGLHVNHLCTVYPINIKDKNLLIIEIQKNNGILQLYNDGAYTRTHDANNILMKSEDIKNYYAAMPTTSVNIESLITQITSVYDLLIEQKKTSELSERKNFLINLGFCVLSAVIGYLLGKFF